MAQLEPGAWRLTVVRALTVLPAPAMPEEIHGLARTARALSENAVVQLSHGDLAALPAVAAGATVSGTGWDPRQRICAYASYEERDAGGDGGQWFQQATLEGLLSLLTRADAALLMQQNAALAQSLLPGPVPPGAKEAFLHHVSVLARIVDELIAADPPSAYRRLVDRYEQGRTDWPAAATAINATSRADAWITPLLDGLQRYGRTEGY
jgi:hypothetical protein